MGNRHINRLLNAAGALKPDLWLSLPPLWISSLVLVCPLAAGLSRGEVMHALSSDGEVEPSAQTSPVIVGSVAAALVWFF